MEMPKNNVEHSDEINSLDTVNETDKFIKHLHNIINNGDYESSSSSDEDYQENNEKKLNNMDDDKQMQKIIDILQREEIVKEKNGRKNKTFSSEKLRDIDRTNTILMKKIISNSRRPSQYTVMESNRQLQNSAAINRRRQQKKIDQDNMVSNTNIYLIVFNYFKQLSAYFFFCF